VAEDNLDPIGRRPSAPGSQQVNADELLAELVRLVESSGLVFKPSSPKSPSPPVETVPEQNLPDREPTQAPEEKSLHASLNTPSTKPKEPVVVEIEPPRALKSDIAYSNHPNGTGLAAGRHSGTWTFRVPALVLAGAAVIGAIFWLGQKSEPSKAPPFAAEAQGQPNMRPRSIASVAISSDAGAIAPSEITQPGESKAASSEERPIDLTARDSLIRKATPSQDLGPTAIGVTQPMGPTTSAPPVAASPAAAPAFTAPVAASPPATLQSPDSKDEPTASIQPDPTQTPTPTPSATDSVVGAHTSDAPLPPVRPAPKAANQAGAVAQRLTPKLDFPTKLSSQSGAHVVVKASATGAAAPEAKTPLKTAQASVEPLAAPLAQPAPAPQQPNSNPLTRAFGSVVGAVGAVAGLIPFPGH
jgi:hypothetical protein